MAASRLGAGPGLYDRVSIKSACWSLSTVLLDGVVDKSVGGGVFDLYWSGRLWVT